MKLTKKQVIDLIKSLNCAMVEVICEISNKETKEILDDRASIVVLVGEYCDDGQIINAKHWDVCSGIRGFRNSTSRNAVGDYRVSKFIEVRPFVSDFDGKPKERRI